MPKLPRVGLFRRRDDEQPPPFTRMLMEDPMELSAWFFLYLKNPALDDPSFLKEFRTNFRLPYGEFIKLRNTILQQPSFARWEPGRKNHFGDPASPIELLLLGTLRYLGRGVTFADICESTFIGRETHRQFFHLFIEFGSTVLYKQFVDDYRTKANLTADRDDYAIAGLPGAVGSLDATHVMLEKCTMSNAILHKGFKMSQPARTYNITVNHRRYIISSTKGCPGSWNDKSVIRCDSLAMSMKDSADYDYLSFELFERGGPLGIRKQAYIGGWFIVDNGYQPWSIFIPPFKCSTTEKEKKWSNWVESVRKDVECTFGILKGRWRILKSGCRLHGTHILDKIFLTCCALHNLLLEVDGLNVGWELGVQSDWEGELGHLDLDDIPPRSRNSALQYAHRIENIDLSMEEERDRDALFLANLINEDNDGEDYEIGDPLLMNCLDENGFYTVRNLTRDFFRQKLVDHYDIALEKRMVRWPK